ncbi:hypothetical protein SPRG_07402 [Saprolegnia parasitica CBS 223.65]|uniref:Uncharacterized protein n=1 Tax=Saprolegnia parasitica (strain CBS 223.65) TaxID=695850 RepID=A0A067CBE4_SAPPC|nr:hypothetical protein SPRG_07402 [Saprolegnia parasitica CBS 223.65]KDO27803.1 hypothetical protein SPRG_07402 [Saprolegnia parasitica CBS 223.65]|eukprot:XP_012201578.1 hypothetical protein SPRG_07402 [Saprolegnia parasitica CBS 223.65]
MAVACSTAGARSGVRVAAGCACGSRARPTASHATSTTRWSSRPASSCASRKKEYENVPGTRLYRLMRMYRLSHLDAIADMTAIIDLASMHKRLIMTDMTELLARKDALAAISSHATMTTKQKRDAMQTALHMPSRYADLNLASLQKPPAPPMAAPVSIHTLEPHLKRLLEVAAASIAKTRLNLTTCKAFVQTYASTRIQCMVRGRLTRHAHVHDVITFWGCAEMAAAVRLQLLVRRRQATARVHRARSAWWARRRGVAILHLQRIARGYLARQHYAEARANVRAARTSAAVLRLQCWWRSLTAQAFVARRRRTVHAELDHRHRHASATTIQRYYRGYEGRRTLRRLRMEASLSEPVRALATQYMATGDLWAFLRAVDHDYRRFLHDKQDEEENATTFVQKFLREKHMLEEKAIQAWHVSRALESPVLQRYERTASAYTTASSPERPSHSSSPPRPPAATCILSQSRSPSPERQGSPSKPVAPASLFAPEASPDEVALGRLAPESADLPDKYSPKLLRLAMAEGYSLPEVIAGLRGLEAQGRSIRSIKLLLRELRRRTPLMRNSFRSERVVRAAEPVRDRPVLAMLSSKSSPTALRSPTALPTSTKEAPFATKTEIQTYILHALPSGIKEPIAKFLFVAGLFIFVPPTIDARGNLAAQHDPWLASRESNPHLRAYLRMPPGLLKVRREQLLTSALDGSCAILKSHGLVHARDLAPYDVAHLVDWKIPLTLAQSIFWLFQSLIEMARNVRPTTLVRRLHTETKRPTTQDTEVFEGGFSPRADTPAIVARARLEDEVGLFADMKARLEAQVLSPVAMSHSIYELLFQAVFVTLPVHADDLETYGSHHLDAFVHMLVAPQMDVLSTQRLLKKRCERASAVARDYSNVFRDAGCHVVRDIVHRQLNAFQLPMGLDEQVRVLVGRLVFASPTPQRRSTPDLVPLTRPMSSTSVDTVSTPSRANHGSE